MCLYPCLTRGHSGGSTHDGGLQKQQPLTDSFEQEGCSGICPFQAPWLQQFPIDAFSAQRHALGARFPLTRAREVLSSCIWCFTRSSLSCVGSSPLPHWPVEGATWVSSRAGSGAHRSSIVKRREVNGGWKSVAHPILVTPSSSTCSTKETPTNQRVCPHKGKGRRGRR